MKAAVVSPRGGTRAASTIVLAMVAALATAGYLTDAPSWWGWTPTVVSAWTGQNITIWVVGAALSSWTVYPVFSKKLSERIRLGVRSRQRSVLVSLIPIALGVSITSLLPLLVGLLWQSSVGLESSTWPTLLLWVASTVVVGVAFVGLGAVVAMLIPMFAAPLVAATVTYLAALIPAYTVESVSWELLPPDFGLHFGNGVPPVLGVSLRLLFWSIVAVTLIAVISKSWRTVGVLSAAFVATGVVASSVGSGLERPPEYEGAACLTVTKKTVVCVPETQRAGLSAYALIIGEGLSKLPAEYAPPMIVGSEDLLQFDDTESSTGPLIVEPTSGTNGATNLPNREETLVELGTALLDPGQCPGQESFSDTEAAVPTAADDPTVILALWWKSELGLSLDRTYGYNDFADPQLFGESDFAQAITKAKALRSMPRAERDSLLIRNHDTIAECTVKAIDFP